MAIKKPKFKYPAVMLLDDDDIDNFINMKMIEGCHFSENVQVHTSGKSALEFLQNLIRLGDAGKNLFPSIIFLDLNMPVMDGFQFADEFEKFSDAFKKSTTFLVLTTSLNPDDEIKAKKYKRVIKFVNKPLTQELLASL